LTLYDLKLHRLDLVSIIVVERHGCLGELRRVSRYSASMNDVDVVEDEQVVVEMSGLPIAARLDDGEVGVVW
jgi:hypothetical protein